jgi:hypothetical protein
VNFECRYDPSGNSGVETVKRAPKHVAKAAFGGQEVLSKPILRLGTRRNNLQEARFGEFLRRFD